MEIEQMLDWIAEYHLGVCAKMYDHDDPGFRQTAYVKVNTAREIMQYIIAKIDDAGTRQKYLEDIKRRIDRNAQCLSDQRLIEILGE